MIKNLWKEMMVYFKFGRNVRKIIFCQWHKLLGKKFRVPPLLKILSRTIIADRVFFSFMSWITPKPKQLQCPITTNVNNKTNQWELSNTRNQRQARENACDQVAIGFDFVSDWLSRWHEFFNPITERSKVKPKQFCNYLRHSRRFATRFIQFYYYYWDRVE